MGPRLTWLAGILARRYGPRAVALLVRSGRAWLADPADAAARDALVAQLRAWGARAGGAVGARAARLADEVARRRGRSVPGWERELMMLRYRAADTAPGPLRSAALAEYADQAWAGVALVRAAAPAHAAGTRARVRAALGTEEALLAGERLAGSERRRALAAVRAAAAACEGRPRATARGPRRLLPGRGRG